MSEAYGVSSGTISESTKELTNINVNIKKCFDDMTTIVGESSKYLESNSSDAIRSKFNDIAKNFDNIVANLELYRDDLLRVEKNHKGYVEDVKTSSVQELLEKGGDYDGVNNS